MHWAGAVPGSEDPPPNGGEKFAHLLQTKRTGQWPWNTLPDAPHPRGGTTLCKRHKPARVPMQCCFWWQNLFWNTLSIHYSEGGILSGSEVNKQGPCLSVWKSFPNRIEWGEAEWFVKQDTVCKVQGTWFRKRGWPRDRTGAPMDTWLRSVAASVRNKPETGSCKSRLNRMGNHFSLVSA